MTRLPGGTRNLRVRLPVVLYMVLLFGLSSLPGDSIGVSSLPGLDKLLHAFAYAGLGVLLMRLFSTSPLPLVSRRAIFWTILTGTLYGVSDEWHQSYVPGRDTSVLDVAADALGCAAGALLYGPKRREADRRVPPGETEERKSP